MRDLIAAMLGEDPMNIGFLYEENDGGAGGAGGGGTGAAAPKTYTEAEYNALVAERNTVAGERDTVAGERDTFKTKAEQFEQSQLTEQQKLEQRATAAEQEKTDRDNALKQERVERAIERESRKLNIVDEDTALKLLDQSKIQYDDAGKPRNIADLLTQLVKDKPFLVASAGAGASATNASRSGHGAQTASQQIDQQWQKTGRGNSFRL